MRWRRSVLRLMFATWAVVVVVAVAFFLARAARMGQRPPLAFAAGVTELLAESRYRAFRQVTNSDFISVDEKQGVVIDMRTGLTASFKDLIVSGRNCTPVEEAVVRDREGNSVRATRLCEFVFVVRTSSGLRRVEAIASEEAFRERRQELLGKNELPGCPSQ